MRLPKSTFSILGLGLLAGASMGTLQGCDDGPLGNLAEKCGLTCPTDGIIEGNFAISGVASVDAFFASVVTVDEAATKLEAGVRAELVGLAKLLEIEGAAELSLGDLSAQVSTALTAKFEANIEGSITIDFEPAKCEASVEASVEAAANCDVNADPGSIEASCSGSCEVSAEVAAECEAMGNLKCEGTAPNFQCEGTCTGSCQLEVAASCSGTCNGSCEGSCSVCSGGACDDQGGTVANCAGQCMGMCTGECKLEAGGSCGGSCEGSCEYTPPSGGCTGSATAKCDVSAMGDVKCEGKCEGSVEPPEVSAECEASVEAKAKAEIECTPPSLQINYQFAAGLDASAQAEFKAFIQGFRVRYAAMLAATAKAEFVLEAGADLVAAAGGAVEGAISAAASGDADLSVAIGLGCALDELGNVGTALSGATSKVEGSISAIASVSGSVGN